MDEKSSGLRLRCQLLFASKGHAPYDPRLSLEKIVHVLCCIPLQPRPDEALRSKRHERGTESFLTLVLTAVVARRRSFPIWALLSEQRSTRVSRLCSGSHIFFGEDWLAVGHDRVYPKGSKDELRCFA